MIDILTLAKAQSDAESFIDIFFILIIPVALLLMGLIFGSMIESRHFKRLEEGEAAYEHVMLTDFRSFPMAGAQKQPPMMLTSEAVIGSDYLKSFFIWFRKIFGGEVKSLLTVSTRARREAILRLKIEADEKGYNALCNLRCESTDITGSATRSKAGITAACAVASATAYSIDAPASP